jgi:sugar-specific transcriptional regulator TrmB
LGLTPSQAKIYIALLELGKATGKTVSQHSKVARQEAYRILAALQEKGLVEKIITAPTKFEPIPIEDCVSVLIESKKNEISETQIRTARLIQKFQEKNSHAIREEEPRLVMVSEKAVLWRLRRGIENTQTALDVITGLNRFRSAMFNFEQDFKKALKRDVKLRFITNKPEDQNSLTKIVKILTKSPLFEVRYVSTPPFAVIAIYDGKEVTIAVSASADITEVPILMSNNPSLVALAQNYFETVWNTTEPERP